ncbi:MAG: glycosyltransferase [Betaproteobacteria bacterium]|nr:glycosyltransferase [Betaproteobacteria bacterium]MDH5222768.1 glycosyltransferase [Betaproteobacteria bacterium]MDH5350157.1 glycosyltransferase [Betaproteobacteria bacterium]
MKRICFVTTSPLIVNFFLVPHLRRLASRYEVSLAVTLPGEAPLKDLPGVHVEPVTIPRRIRPLGDLRALQRLTHLFRERRYALVHSFGPKAGLLSTWAGMRAGVPARLHTFTGQVWASRRGTMRALLRAADRATARRATEVLADSASQRDFLIREGIVAAEHCRVLGAGSVCGVDAQRFRPDAAARAAVRAELGIGAQAPIVLFVGRVTRDKGVLDLAQAFGVLGAEYPEAVLLVVGPDEEGLGAQVRRLCGERARVVGYTHTPERYMAAADLLCLPSYREGFGAVVIEAAAAGLPAIGSRIYGIVDAVQDGKTGLLFEPGNVGELQAHLRRLLGDEALREHLGTAARERALKEFAEERLVGALEARYRQILGG